MKTCSLPLLLSALLAGAPAQSENADCEAVRRSTAAGMKWSTVARGIEVARMAPNAEALDDLLLIRFDTRLFRARPYDLRNIAVSSQSKGFYSAPLFALIELQGVLPQATLVLSGGMTRSYSEPIPAGFLKIEGRTLVAVAPKDKRLNGVLCIDRDGKASIQSEQVEGTRRAPREVEHCFSGIQAGPMLVAGGQAEPGLNKTHTAARLAFGTIGQNTALVAFSNSASKAALSCALTSEGAAVDAAIGLQGDRLGGAVLGPVFSSASVPRVWGSVDATIASALVIEARRPDVLRLIKR